MKYLELYYDWMESGKIPYKVTKKTNGGLCSIFPKSKLLQLCLPENGFTYYCGFSNEWALGDPATVFTPLRQNIILLMACMANEY